jgi:hypothetical protein
MRPSMLTLAPRRSVILAPGYGLQGLGHAGGQERGAKALGHPLFAQEPARLRARR